MTINENTITEFECDYIDGIVTDDNLNEVLSWGLEHRDVIENVYHSINNEEFISATVTAFYYHHAFQIKVQQEIEELCK
jgi:hypothetical protein